MKRIDELRRQAERYLWLRMYINDPAATQAIGNVASELEMTAEQLERREHFGRAPTKFGLSTLAHTDGT
jgi:hypothetical protein